MAGGWLPPPPPSNVLNGETTASGPNGSSFITRASFGTSVSTVGSKKLPLLPMRCPPAWTVAPRCVASSMKPSIAVMRRGLAIGPIVVLASSPSPTFTASLCRTKPLTN
jgi:hypothetical protein